ncbi:MAG: alpha,alpha-phosphotrehalase [Spirochaetes bacterium]|jgi:oligo-1,6-glucosidase|nr:alpha,alpha-phosphotrehalase [Spirochaetota bacterium]
MSYHTPSWWKEATAYQIYPRSFNDSNGDGIGDLAGITEKLDYLGELGIDLLWISPVYQSPNADNGYDISDYREIMDEFGTMGDMTELIRAAHGRGIRIVMDLVVNHTSDKHAWFRSSRSNPEGPYGDYYIWGAGRNGGPPNNWLSAFGGEAWSFDERRGQYYLHIYTPNQPDLNWDNPRLRADIYAMMRFWLERGVDGFRMDVINQISKPPALPDDTDPAPGTRPGFRFYTNGPNVHSHIREMNAEVLSHYDIVTIGEMHATGTEEALRYVSPERNELDMIFHFEHMLLDAGPGGKWDVRPIDLDELKRVFTRWQQALHGRGWNSLFLNNHDYPRMVSRFGDDGEYRVQSAKLLAGVTYLMQGTPFLFQGEEIGMTNASFETIESYRDVETLNYYAEQRAAGVAEAEIMRRIHLASRDNARTPFQWNGVQGAGFTTGTPWIPLNDNYRSINLAAQWDEPDSVLSFYRRLIRLRKESAAALYGDFEVIEEAASPLFVYRRQTEGEMLTVVANLSSTKHAAPQETGRGTLALSNYADGSPNITALRPWELVVLTGAPVQPR